MAGRPWGRPRADDHASLQRKWEAQLGVTAASLSAVASGEVDLLLRPDDVRLCDTGTANGTVEWVRFEGGSRLCAVALDDAPDTQVKARVSHEHVFRPEQRVHVQVDSTHALAAFQR